MKHRRKIITTGAIWSEKLASVPHDAERLYWRIYMASDNYGVMSGKPWDVLQQAAPGVVGFDLDVVTTALDSLVAVTLLERWEHDARPYLYVTGHDDIQAADFIRKRGARRSPLPPSLAQSAPAAAKGSEGQAPAIHAVPCPSGEKDALSTSISTSTTTSTISSSSTGDEDEFVDEIPKTHPRDIGVQIKQARGRLGSLTLSVETIIANSQSDRDDPFTDRELVNLFYRPACDLLNEVGHSRMRAALGTAIENGASRIQYAATVARSEHRKGDIRVKAEKAANGIPEIGRKPSEDELRSAGLLPPAEGVAS